ncbi:TMEM175 family protein [Lactobacillus gasseri]|uniref:TMEM175 family protein n=1 Tax=Lactobacillus gasseri TaxID=1596 RepID=UPI0023AA1483|nr:TMEM175 family protein [Lactobacillus gasseri]WEB64317.1 TMEM175 family protein [Lactobacillus gasseri]WEB65954.1 TMEM175 family protein [Lactobacillus gasseri]
MRRNKHQHNFNDFSDQEKEKLKTVRQELTQAQKKEPERLWEHLQAFNNGVMAIIITIIVLEIQPAIHEVHYEQFIANIIVFLITFFVVADFWYDLHLAFSYYIFKPTKTIAILDFFFLADLSLLPVMTKWIMAESSTFAVANFGIVFLIAKILEYLIQYFGAKKTAKYSQIMNIIISRSFIRKVAVTLFLNVILIVLSLFIPRIAMILYLVIPVTSFLFPVKRNKIV